MILVYFTVGVAVVFTPNAALWTARILPAISIAAIAVAAGIVVVLMRSTAARGAAGELARALDASDHSSPAACKKPSAARFTTPTPGCCSPTRAPAPGWTATAARLRRHLDAYIT